MSKIHGQKYDLVEKKVLFKQTIRVVLATTAVRIVFHFESNRIDEQLFEISNRIVIVGLKSHQ